MKRNRFSALVRMETGASNHNFARPRTVELDEGHSLPRTKRQTTRSPESFRWSKAANVLGAMRIGLSSGAIGGLRRLMHPLEIEQQQLFRFDELDRGSSMTREDGHVTAFDPVRRQVTIDAISENR